MVGVLGPNPSVDTEYKWLIISHLFVFIGFKIKYLLHFCYIFYLDIKKKMPIFAAVLTTIIQRYGKVEVLFEDIADIRNVKSVCQNRPPCHGILMVD